jgi:hypothetical protein
MPTRSLPLVELGRRCSIVASVAAGRFFVDTVWPALEQLGLADGASRSRLRFDPDIARACADCVFVQESGP